MAATYSGRGQQTAPRRESFFDRTRRNLSDFWRRVSEGLEVRTLWNQFVSEARESYSLYDREVDWDALKRESRFRRILKTISALFWAMIMKLSPARRVFLLVALVLGLFSLPQGNQGGPHVSPLIPLGMLIFLLALELADRVTMKRDLEIAREIQHWLVPATPPQVPGVDLAFNSTPANTVGGDYYDAFLPAPEQPPGKDNPLLMVVADVAGKSVPAALLMATFHACLRSVTTAADSLTEIVVRMNRYACAHSLEGRRFTTAFFAEFDPSTRVLTYVRAGHNEPFLLHASGQFERLDSGDLPLGINPNAPYACSQVTLESGDLLLIYTDGLVEAVNEREEEFGEQRVIDILKTVPRESAAETLQRLLRGVRSFTGSRRQYDDITTFVVRAT
ncbi:MAG: PP2C family protein-serine/threonine phosphatase [Acidobacteriota bacterium]